MTLSILGLLSIKKSILPKYNKLKGDLMEKEGKKTNFESFYNIAQNIVRTPTSLGKESANPGFKCG